MPRDYQLEKEISDSLAKFSTKLDWDDDYYHINVTKETKIIKVSWVFSTRTILFRFLMKETVIYHLWAKYGKDKSFTEIWDKTAEVITRFLNCPERTVVRGKWLKAAYLEVNENGQWVDLFNNFNRYNIKLRRPGTSLLDVVFNRSHRPSKSIDLPRDYQLEKEIADAFAEYSMTLDWGESLYTIEVTKGTKRITVNWAYDVHEVYFDFFENDNKIYKDWADYYTGETNSEIVNDVILIVKRFINLPSRVITQGKMLKTTELEVSENGQWENIYEIFWK